MVFKHGDIFLKIIRCFKSTILTKKYSNINWRLTDKAKKN